jgi:transcription-repair coupling factor (superfamily II helicase)
VIYGDALGHARLRAGEEAALDDALSTPEINLDLPLDHFIPRSYIRDERLRLGAYRELAAAEDLAALEAGLRSLRDRYGPPPAQLQNLAYSLRVKLRGQELGLRSVGVEDGQLVVRVDPDRPLDVDELSRRFGGRLRVLPNRLRLSLDGTGWQEELMRLLDVMSDLYDRARITTSV